MSDGSDAAEMRSVVETWAIARDSGDWQTFATTWHTDGWMTATWFQGPSSQFIEASREGFRNGVQIAHFLGGHTSVIEGTRAIAQTKMKIEQRATIDGIDVDVTCSGRFFDFFERRDGRWAISRRQPIYEKDRIDAVDPSATATIDPTVLNRFPRGYRYLALVQEKLGYRVLTALPGLQGTEVQTVYAEGRGWLAGSPAPGSSHLDHTFDPIAG